MNTRYDEGLFGALEKELKKAKEPLDCATLFDRSSVRQHATTVNRVSDYLGNMWRKGQVKRFHAAALEGTRARYVYEWDWKKKKEPVVLGEPMEFAPRVNAILSRPNIEVTEEGDSIVITLPAVTITIKQRK